MVGTVDNVLIREVSFNQSVLYREVPLYPFMCMCMYLTSFGISTVTTWLHGYGCPQHSQADNSFCSSVEFLLFLSHRTEI